MGRFQNYVRSLTLKVFAKRKLRKTYDLGGEEGGGDCMSARNPQTKRSIRIKSQLCQYDKSDV